jgi:hypothetical protein
MKGQLYGRLENYAIIIRMEDEFFWATLIKNKEGYDLTSPARLALAQVVSLLAKGNYTRASGKEIEVPNAWRRLPKPVETSLKQDRDFLQLLNRI